VGRFRGKAAPVKQPLLFSGLRPKAPNLLLGQRHGHSRGGLGNHSGGKLPDSQEVPPDAPVGQKRGRTFSDDFVKEYMI